MKTILKALKIIAGPTGTYTPESVFFVDEKTARDLIDSGAAERIPPEPVKKAKRVVMKPVKKVVRRKVKKK